jgi:hypothetical protein
LVQNPDSLCARVLRAKYFRDTSCLEAEATPKTGMSYTWKPITPRGANIIPYVDEFVNPVTGCWDTELVHDIFWEEDVKIILAMPIYENREKILAWRFDPKRNFSVLSARVQGLPH